MGDCYIWAFQAREIPDNSVTLPATAQGAALVRSCTDPHTTYMVTEPLSSSGVCSCPAGVKGNFCKHKAKVLLMTTNASEALIVRVCGTLAGSAAGGAGNLQLLLERQVVQCRLPASEPAAMALSASDVGPPLPGTQLAASLPTAALVVVAECLPAQPLTELSATGSTAHERSYERALVEINTVLQSFGQLAASCPNNADSLAYLELVRGELKAAEQRCLQLRDRVVAGTALPLSQVEDGFNNSRLRARPFFEGGGRSRKRLQAAVTLEEGDSPEQQPVAEPFVPLRGAKKQHYCHQLEEDAETYTENLKRLQYCLGSQP